MLGTILRFLGEGGFFNVLVQKGELKREFTVIESIAYAKSIISVIERVSNSISPNLGTLSLNGFHL